MLRRIATVIWWVGLLALSVGAVASLSLAYRRWDCAATLELDSDIGKADDAARAQYLKDHYPKLDPSAPHLVADIESAVNVRDDPRDTAEHKENLAVCR